MHRNRLIVASGAFVAALATGAAVGTSIAQSSPDTSGGPVDPSEIPTCYPLVDAAGEFTQTRDGRYIAIEGGGLDFDLPGHGASALDAAPGRSETALGQIDAAAIERAVEQGRISGVVLVDDVADCG